MLESNLDLDLILKVHTLELDCIIIHVPICDLDLFKAFQF